MSTPLRAGRGGALRRNGGNTRTKRPALGRGTERIREALVGYAFILVPMAFFLLFFIFPIGYAVYISRYDWGILGKFDYVGWDNYSRSSTMRSSCAPSRTPPCSPSPS